MSIKEELTARLAKRKKLESYGINPYPAGARRTHGIKEIVDRWDRLAKTKKNFFITGRIRSIRGHGGLVFAHLEDGGGKIQTALRRDNLGAERFNFFGETADVGDFLEAGGALFLTKKGEKTLDISEFRVIAKTMRPLPEKWHGLADTELRYRKRYLDLIANERVRWIFETRSAMVKAIRGFFDERGFLEVETPILQPIPGGANAEPFVTHHNALDIDLYLRIAPELYLKRLLVGGMERVYELARCFRNEGIDHLHNPEFTQIEAYQAYANYNEFMGLIEECLPYVIGAVGLDVKKVMFEDEKIDFSAPYPRLKFHDALKKYAKINLDDHKDRASIARAAEKIGLDAEDSWSRGKIMDEIFKKTVRPKLLAPTFIIDHPIELSPLAKRREDNPAYAERFQLLVARGTELVNAFSELNDPQDQKERFLAQEEARKRGEEEAQRLDEDFITALAHGMPPAAGLGIGIDRLAALLTNSHNIKEVILFPTLRPE